LEIRAKIIVKKYLFDPDTNIADVNFFNLIDGKTLIESRDLSDYLINKSPTQFDKPDIITGYTNETIMKCGEVDLVFEEATKDFFDIESIDPNKKRTIWYVWIFDENNVQTFFGTITGDDIRFAQFAGNDSHEVSAKAFSLSQNFLEYLQKQTCQDNITFDRIAPIGGNYKYTTLTNFFKQLLFNNNSEFEVIDSTRLIWYVNHKPHFFRAGNEFWYLKHGYYKAAQDSMSYYDLFFKACAVLGWDPIIYNDYLTGKTILEIRDKVPLVNSIHSVTLEDEGVNIVNLQEYEKSGIEYIVIQDGYIKTGNLYASQGNPIKIISDNITVSNKGNFFGSVVDKGNWYELHPQPPGVKYIYKNAVTNDNDYLDWGEISYLNQTHWHDRNNERKNLRSKNILFIDGGENSLGTVCDMATKAIYEANDIGDSDSDVLFRGCIGSMFFTLNSFGAMQYNFDGYSQTSIFYNNHKSILSGKNRDIVEIEIDSLLSGYYKGVPNQIYINSSNPYYNNSFWKILSCKLDESEYSTTLKISRSI